MTDDVRLSLTDYLAKHYANLRRRLTQVLGNSDLASDALQDTWLRLHGKEAESPIQSPAAYVVRMPELVIDKVLLPSKPLPGATGLVPDAGVAYIAQAHPQGRITFINLETGVPRTITGFEIASKVVNGK